MPGPSIRSAQIISICMPWNFLEVKANQNTMHALQMALKANKVAHVSTAESLHFSKVKIIQFCHPSRQTTHALPVVYDHCTLRSSERVVPTSSAPLLTNQHENADVSFIDLRSYIPEISGVRSSKLPPLYTGCPKKPATVKGTLWHNTISQD